MSHAIDVYNPYDVFMVQIAAGYAILRVL